MQDRIWNSRPRISHLQHQMTILNIAVNANLSRLGVPNCIRDDIVHDDCQQVRITLNHGHGVSDFEA